MTTQGHNSIHPDQHCLVFAPDRAKIIYSGNDGGIYRSSNSGSTWKSLNKGLGSARSSTWPATQTHGKG